MPAWSSSVWAARVFLLHVWRADIWWIPIERKVSPSLIISNYFNPSSDPERSNVWLHLGLHPAPQSTDPRNESQGSFRRTDLQWLVCSVVNVCVLCRNVSYHVLYRAVNRCAFYSLVNVGVSFWLSASVFYVAFIFQTFQPVSRNSSPPLQSRHAVIDENFPFLLLLADIRCHPQALQSTLARIECQLPMDWFMVSGVNLRFPVGLTAGILDFFWLSRDF